MSKYKHYAFPIISKTITVFLCALLTNLCAVSASQADVVSTTPSSPQLLPTIGEPADRLISPAQEKKLGADYFRNLYRADAILEDPEIVHYIQHLGNNLTNTLDNNDNDYTFFVVKDSRINAFAVPGGYIGINAGLIMNAKTEHELAGVMAHEIAHVSQRHIARRMSDMQRASAPTLGAIFAGMLLAAGGNARAGQALLYAGIAAGQQFNINFTRNNEIEADRIGLNILYSAGYDPNGMADFFRTLQRQRLVSSPEYLEFLRTHPVDIRRIAEAQIRIDRLPAQNTPDSLSFHLIKARLNALMSDDTQSLVYALEKEPHFQKTSHSSIVDRYAYSQALEMNGENIKAANILKSVVRTDEENINFQIAIARSHQNNGQNQNSLITLEKLVRIYPDNYPVMLYYAEALKNHSRAHEGRDLLENYLRQYRPATKEIYKLLAELYAQTGEKTESKQTMAEYYYQTGNFNGAIVQLKDALRQRNLDYITRSQIEKRLKEILWASYRS